MHVTPSRWINVAVTTLWALLLGFFLQTTRPFPTIEFVVGLLLGLIAGRLRHRAIRVSIVLAWVNGLGLLIWAMAFAPDMFVGAWLAGVAAFGFSRELAALPSILRLANLRGPGHGS